MTDTRVVLVHTVPFNDRERLKQACVAVAWTRKLLDDLNTDGRTGALDPDKLPTRMQQLHDAQLLLDGLVIACLAELDAEGTTR